MINVSMSIIHNTVALGTLRSNSEILDKLSVNQIEIPEPQINQKNRN